MTLPTLFANNTVPTGPQLDADLAAVGAIGTIPCTVSGTNTITMTPNVNTPDVTAYANYGLYSGVASASNTSTVTARVGSLAFLNVYRDSPAGPVALVANDIVHNCAFTLQYDSALNSGSGGFHLFSLTNAFPATGGTIAGSASITGLFTAASLSATGAFQTGVSGTAATLTRLLSNKATLTYTVTPTQTHQDQNMTLTGAAIGDDVALGYSVAQTGALFGGYIPAAGTVSVRLLNAGAASIAAFTVVMRATARGFA